MLRPYPLPLRMRQQVLDLAAEADALLLGETHGTQEVPQLVLALADDLAERGYGGLALEIPRDVQQPLEAWASAETAGIPPCFAAPDFSGRANLQALSLARALALRGWRLLCFDQDGDQPAAGWADRDRIMAENLAAQWDGLCPGRRVLAVCGNAHSRLAPGRGERAEMWPSFAAGLQALRPGTTVRSVAVIFRRGTFYNAGVRRVIGPPLGPAVRPRSWLEHSMDLVLPEAHAATFAAPPGPPPGGVWLP